MAVFGQLTFTTIVVLWDEESLHFKLNVSLCMREKKMPAVFVHAIWVD